jgi:hypothetical protein
VCRTSLGRMRKQERWTPNAREWSASPANLPLDANVSNSSAQKVERVNISEKSKGTIHMYMKSSKVPTINFRTK